MRPQLLIVDGDERSWPRLRQVLGGEFDVAVAHGRSGAVRVLEEHRPPVVLVNLASVSPSPDPEERFAALSELLTYDRSVKLIVLAERAERRVAVRAVHEGAYGFLIQPAEPDEVEILVKRAYQMASLEREHLDRRQVGGSDRFEGMLGTSRAIRQAFTKLRDIAATEASVLIIGESGTGKEMAAMAIHRRSTRREWPFIPVNCSAIPDNLLELELFGGVGRSRASHPAHRRGHLEAAANGTLFLDDVGALSLPLQTKLLAFLMGRRGLPDGGEDGRTEVRIIAAANADLGKAVRHRFFREELYRALAEVVIELPPLRERKDDFLLLAQAFLKRFSAEHRKGTMMRFTRDALGALSAQDWPGNIRQLENAVRRAVIMAQGRFVTEEDLGLATPVAEPAPGHRGLRQAREAVEKELVQRALNLHAGNISAAAEELGVSRPTLYELIERLRIKRPEADGVSRAYEPRA
jgi:two-component system NtrC family response regulator